jgi:ribokinase
VPAEENWRLLARAKARGAHTVLNVAPFEPVPAPSLELCDVLVLNEIEAAQLAGAQAGFDTLARDLARRSGGICVITLGGDGSIAAQGDELITTAAHPVRVADTTGAGDAFTGALAAALDRGHDLRAALQRASIAGALACTAVGAQASLPRLAEIEARLSP